MNSNIFMNYNFFLAPPGKLPPPTTTASASATLPSTVISNDSNRSPNNTAHCNTPHSTPVAQPTKSSEKVLFQFNKYKNYSAVNWEFACKKLCHFIYAIQCLCYIKNNYNGVFFIIH